MAVFPRHPKALLPKGLLLKGEIALIRRGGLTPFGLSPKTKRKDEIATAQFEEVRILSSILHPEDINYEIASLPLVARNDKKKERSLQ